MIAIHETTAHVARRGEKQMQVDIGKDFSTTTGGRYRRLGAFSGEEFRQTVLAPKLREAIEEGVVLRVRIDTVQRSYQPSFLDEAFAGLIREEHFSPEDVRRHLVIIASMPRFEKYKALAESYIRSAS